MRGSDDTILARLERLAAFGRLLSRYDLLLAVIPVAFLCSLAAGTLLSVPTSNALALASAVGAMALVDALFLNPPRSRGV